MLPTLMSWSVSRTCKASGYTSFGNGGNKPEHWACFEVLSNFQTVVRLIMHESCYCQDVMCCYSNFMPDYKVFLPFRTCWNQFLNDFLRRFRICVQTPGMYRFCLYNFLFLPLGGYVSKAWCKELAPNMNTMGFTYQKNITNDNPLSETIFMLGLDRTCWYRYSF